MQLAMEKRTNVVLCPVNGCVVTVGGLQILRPPWVVLKVRHPLSPIKCGLFIRHRAKAAQTGDDWILHQLDDMQAEQDIPFRKSHGRSETVRLVKISDVCETELVSRLVDMN